MKKLEKYKIAPQVKFIKFKVKHFVEIPIICHDKAVPPPYLTAKNHLPPLNVSPPPLPITGGGHYGNTQKLQNGSTFVKKQDIDKFLLTHTCVCATIL